MKYQDIESSLMECSLANYASDWLNFFKNMFNAAYLSVAFPQQWVNCAFYN